MKIIQTTNVDLGDGVDLMHHESVVEPGQHLVRVSTHGGFEVTHVADSPQQAASDIARYLRDIADVVEGWAKP